MKLGSKPYPIYNYPDIFSEHFFRGTAGRFLTCPGHVLIFVFSGKLIVTCGSYRKTVRQGEYIFLHQNEDIILDRKSCHQERFSSLFMGFSACFLSDFYRNLPSHYFPDKEVYFHTNIVELSRNPYLDSLYLSLYTYLKANTVPANEIIELKLKEGVYTLLTTDKRFYNCLFACGRNKERFRIQETTCIKILENCRITDIYIEAGYKDPPGIRELSGRIWDILPFP